MILDKLAESSRARVMREMEQVPLEEMKRRAFLLTEEKKEFPFEKALQKRDINFICEVKKASPSKGIIAEDFPYLEIGEEYEEAGAACISVLTEPEYFLGKNEYLTAIAEAVSIPVIRKDFTVDEYQIYQAKTIGASCVLLICALLDLETLKHYLAVCDSLDLSALVEAHDEKEIQMALDAGARIIGVNNRDLRTFEVDIHNSERLRKLVPEHVLFVAESGIKTAEDIQVLREAKVNGVLIGETFMRSRDKKGMLEKLRGENKNFRKNWR